MFFCLLDVTFPRLTEVPLSPPGQDERPEPEQRSRRLLHSGWRLGLGHAGGSDRVLLQVQGRGEENEGGKECTDF